MHRLLHIGLLCSSLGFALFLFAALLSSTALLTNQPLVPASVIDAETTLYTFDTGLSQQNMGTPSVVAETTATSTHQVELHDWRAWQQLSPVQQAKVDERILAELRGEILPTHLGNTADQQAAQPRQPIPLLQTRFLLYLQQQPDLTQLNDVVFASQAIKRTVIMQTLQASAQVAQAPLRAFLSGRQQRNQQNSYQPFYIVNVMAVEGGLDLVIALAQRDDVARLVANYPLYLSAQATVTLAQDGTVVAAESDTQQELDPANWNISLVGADRVWGELGVRGEGAVVAGFDTGVSFRHSALVERYRGNLGNGHFDHNYNWFEPDGSLYSNGNLGPSVSQEPISCGNHGTHTLGTAVGDGGLAGTQVGMAPGATWIAVPGICANTLGGGIRDDIGVLKAFQWLLCPTDLSGDLATADCSKAPDVINNSWGAANPVADLLHAMIETLRTANIAPVFSAGNPSANSGSIGSPGNAPAAITVGATDETDQIATFSGRGPSFYPDEQKPELSAPGVDIHSTVGSNGYEKMSGTSMAAPHVAGLIALMIAADLRDGTRDFSVDELETFMLRTAVDLGEAGPDNDYGFGRIDAYRAVRWVLDAGDLRGTIRDATTNQLLPTAALIGQGSDLPFTTATNAQGHYSLTVPAGVYQLSASAWGYVTGTFASQYVVANTSSVADFALQPLPTREIQGTIVSADGAAIGEVALYVKAMPTVRTQTDVAGRYALNLSTGTHELVIERQGYRRQTLAVIVPESAATTAPIVIETLPLEAAPSILLVEADAYRGWFSGWPIDAIFRSALDAEGYLYTHWPLQYPTVTETITLADGSTGYGMPSLATLAAYDVVIWVQSGCNAGGQGCFVANAPTALGAHTVLQPYLDQGGRLILSGQDLGFWEDGATLFTDYIHTSLLADRVAGEGATLTGHGFLQSLTVTVTNASLYGHPNGAIQLAPDAIVGETDATIVYPILTYDEAQLPAALAVDPCNANYRAVYFGVGYENIGERGSTRDPAIAAVLGRAVDWVSNSRLDVELQVAVDNALRFAPAGTVATYELQLINAGRRELFVSLATSGTQWPFRILQEEQPITLPLRLRPCQSVTLRVEVDVPATAADNMRNELTISFNAATGQGVLSTQLAQEVLLTTGAFATWQTKPTMPTPRYRMGTGLLPAIPGERQAALYAIGGWHNTNVFPGQIGTDAATTNQRLNHCTATWESLAPLPQPRAGIAVAALNGQLYAMGGHTRPRMNRYEPAQPHPEVWRYDPATDQWSEVAALPIALGGASAISIGGQIYLFGGVDDQGTITNVTYRYDPTGDTWHSGPEIPGPGRAFAAAALLGNEIALVGGYPALDLVHFYNPNTNSWREGTPLQQGRHSFGLTAATLGNHTTSDDTTLYAVGGAIGDQAIGTVERLNRTQNIWEYMPAVTVPERYGASALSAPGEIVAIGGADNMGNTESLTVGDSFCLSAHTTAETSAAIGAPILYDLQLHADVINLPAASFAIALPAKTRFTEFVVNEVGATYDATNHTIQWQGQLPARAAPQLVRYALESDPQEVVDGDRLTSTVTFATGKGIIFTRSAVVALLSTNLVGSNKTVDKVWAQSGDLLTYTINVQSASAISSTLLVRDPLPPAVAYVPDSLRYRNGQGGYDATSHTIWWEGQTEQAKNAFVNLTQAYLWGDSDGKGSVPAVDHKWIALTERAQVAAGGDNSYLCQLPIGFGFPFYEKIEREFCVSSNGFLSFDPVGNSGDLTNSCPLPTGAANRAVIAAAWDDLVTTEITYQTFGLAPHRYLVVQWEDARRFAALGRQPATFQVVLFETGIIRIAIQEAGELRGLSSTTGIEDHSETQGLTYACNQPGTLHDNLSILFVPPGATVETAQTALQFQTVVAENLSEHALNQAGSQVNVPLTNTVYITSAAGVVERYATTLLNPLDLTASTFTVDRGEVVPDQTATYQLLLRNTGLISATAATVDVNLPPALVYASGSLTCEGGSCVETNGTIQWRGTIAPQRAYTVTFAARLIQGLPDRTPILVPARLADGFGTIYQLEATLLARRSDLSHSRLQFLPRFVEPGTTTTLVAFLQNGGGLGTSAAATITLPSGLGYVEDSLVCGTGRCSFADGGVSGNIVRWEGTLAKRELVPIRLVVQIPETTPYGTIFLADLTVDDRRWQERFTTQADVAAMHNVWLPSVFGSDSTYQLFLPLVQQND